VLRYYIFSADRSHEMDLILILIYTLKGNWFEFFQYHKKIFKKLKKLSFSSDKSNADPKRRIFLQFAYGSTVPESLGNVLDDL
jgi:hypothetical protein